MDRDPGALQHLGRQLLALVNKLDVGQKDLSRRHVVQHHIAQDGSHRLHLFHVQGENDLFFSFFLTTISSFFLFAFVGKKKAREGICSTFRIERRIG
jgi:hypothetical protein